MRKGALVAAAVTSVALAVSAGGCGVQLDEEPRPLATDAVPYGLLDPPPPTTPGTVSSLPPVPALQAVSVFLVDVDGYLVEIKRRAAGAPDVERAVDSLLAPLTQAERDAGLTTAISSTTGLRGLIGPEGGLVTIDLSSTVADASPDIVRVALAQLVYTVTAVPEVDRVLFQVEGQAREVPTGQGQSTAAPLSRLDYRQLLRPPSSTTVPDDLIPGG